MVKNTAEKKYCYEFVNNIGLYDGYDEACSLLSAENLSERRDTLCLTFVKKAVKSGLHSDIFVPANSTKSTRSDTNHLRIYLQYKTVFQLPFALSFQSFQPESEKVVQLVIFDMLVI